MTGIEIKTGHVVQRNYAIQPADSPALTVSEKNGVVSRSFFWPSLLTRFADVVNVVTHGLNGLLFDSPISQIL